MAENVKSSNILYIDDEIHNLNSFRACFRRDFNIFIAQSAMEAREMLTKHEMHVIITDQRMPETTGIEFLESIIETYPDPIRMVLTGYADINAVIDAINKGRVFKYVQKPWQENELKQVIQEGLEQFTLNKINKEIAEKLEENNKQMEFLLRQSLLS